MQKSPERHKISNPWKVPVFPAYWDLIPAEAVKGSAWIYPDVFVWSLRIAPQLERSGGSSPNHL